MSPAGIGLGGTGLKRVGGRAVIIDVKGKGWMLSLKSIVEHGKGMRDQVDKALQNEDVAS